MAIKFSVTHDFVLTESEALATRYLFGSYVKEAPPLEIRRNGRQTVLFFTWPDDNEQAVAMAAFWLGWVMCKVHYIKKTM